jgi:hypothetical protein
MFSSSRSLPGKLLCEEDKSVAVRFSTRPAGKTKKSFKKRDWAFDFVGHSKAHKLSRLLASGENIGLDVEMMLDLYLFR